MKFGVIIEDLSDFEPNGKSNSSKETIIGDYTQESEEDSEDNVPLLHILQERGRAGFNLFSVNKRNYP